MHALSCICATIHGWLNDQLLASYNTTFFFFMLALTSHPTSLHQLSYQKERKNSDWCAGIFLFVFSLFLTFTNAGLTRYYYHCSKNKETDLFAVWVVCLFVCFFFLFVFFSPTPSNPPLHTNESRCGWS